MNSLFYSRYQVALIQWLAFYMFRSQHFQVLLALVKKSWEKCRKSKVLNSSSLTVLFQQSLNMNLSLWYKTWHGIFVCMFISGHSIWIISGLQSLRPGQIIQKSCVWQGITFASGSSGTEPKTFPQGFETPCWQFSYTGIHINYYTFIFFPLILCFCKKSDLFI